MSEEKERKDIPEGFDLPENEPTPPPEEPGAAGEPMELPVEGAPVAPRPAKEGKRPSVLGKFIALIVIPIIAIPILICVYIERTKPLTEYQAQCVGTAQNFLKGLSDDTEESVPAAYNMLSPALRGKLPTERITGDYAEAASGLGKFRKLASPDWMPAPEGEAARAFEAKADFEKGRAPVFFHFMRVMTDNGPRVLIDRYRLGAKSSED